MADNRQYEEGTVYEAGVGIYFSDGEDHTNINVEDELLNSITVMETTVSLLEDESIYKYYDDTNISEFPSSYISPDINYKFVFDGIDPANWNANAENFVPFPTADCWESWVECYKRPGDDMSADSTMRIQYARVSARSHVSADKSNHINMLFRKVDAGYPPTDLPTGKIATVTDGTALLMPSLKVGIEPVQEGSGDPSPDNIRPISGWTAANVTRTGKNITDGATNGHYINTDGTLGDLSSYRYIDYVNIDGITKLKATVSTTYPNFWVWRIASYDINKNFIELSLNRTIANGDFEEEVTLPSNAKYIRACAIVHSTNWNIFDESIYNTYTIQFKDGDNPLTVYGGTLDVTSGELVVDRVETDLGEITWRKSTDDVFWYSNDLAGIAKTYPNNVPNKVIFEKYESKPSRAGGYYPNEPNTISLNANSVLYATSETTPTGQCVYELATPTTYHLTPTQIRTLVGNNNIWADTGDILEGKYFKLPTWEIVDGELYLGKVTVPSSSDGPIGYTRPSAAEIAFNTAFYNTADGIIQEKSNVNTSVDVITSFDNTITNWVTIHGRGPALMGFTAYNYNGVSRNYCVTVNYNWANPASTDVTVTDI